MSARGDDSSDSEGPHEEHEGSNTPEGADDSAGSENATGRLPRWKKWGRSSKKPSAAPSPKRRRRARIALYTSGALVLLLVVTLAVPATREGLWELWCRATDRVCPGDAPPISEEEREEELDWRMRISPEDAALWGNYVALGDSYSSGDGAGDYDPATMEQGGCWRSANAYPYAVEEEFDFSGSLGFYACSGHKGSDMLGQIGDTESQIDRVTEHTSLVTLGIGGNDLGFMPVLRTCMMRMPLLDSSGCVDQEDEIHERLDTFEEHLAEIITEIHDRAPDARILVLGYPRLFPEEPTDRYYTLNVDDQLWMNTIARDFNDRIRDVAYQADGDVYGDREVGSVEYVNVFSSLQGYEVSAEEAWLNGIVLGELGEGLRVDRSSFHPTAQGQVSIAERVREQVEEGPERVLYVTRDIVENVDGDQLFSELGGPLDPENAPDEEADGEGEDGAGDEEDGSDEGG